MKTQQKTYWRYEMKTQKILLGGMAAIVIIILALVALAPNLQASAAGLERRNGPGGGAAAPAAGAGGQVQNSTGNVNRGPAGGNPGYYSGQTGAILTPLSAAEEKALQDAILEEYGAYNLYNAVIAKFGSEYPFSRIVRSEQQHINALVRLAERYGVSVPANPGLANPPAFTTVEAACSLGVAAEKADAALYDELKPVVTHTDLLQVFNNLQAASLNSHLPAFEACQ
jgi:hypothetical protein